MLNPTPPQNNTEGFLGWRMVGMGFLCQNLAIGCTFGTYGLLVVPLTETFEASRSASSMGIALITLIMGLTAPLIGRWLDRYSIKVITMIGATLIGFGFTASAFAPSLLVFLGAYTLLVGTGVAMMGPLAAATLANNWFHNKRGVAIGIVNIPLLVAVMPIVFSYSIANIGWRHSLLATGAIFFLILPVLLAIVSRPKDRGQRALGEALETTTDETTPPPLHSATSLLKHPLFWGIVLFSGMITAGSIVIITHIVPYATDYGIPAQQASFLLGVNGLCAMIGALAMGWVSDRTGPHVAAGITALMQALIWCLLLTRPPFETLLLAVIGIGIAGGGVTPAFYALLAKTFGPASFGSAVGLGSLILVPLTFGAPIFAGFLFDTTGNYQLALQIHIALFGAAALFFLVLFPKGKTK